MVQWKAKSVARAPSLFSGKKKSEENLTNEVLTAVAAQSAVLWDVTLIGCLTAVAAQSAVLWDVTFIGCLTAVAVQSAVSCGM